MSQNQASIIAPDVPHPLLALEIPAQLAAAEGGERQVVEAPIPTVTAETMNTLLGEPRKLGRAARLSAFRKEYNRCQLMKFHGHMDVEKAYEWIQA